MSENGGVWKLLKVSQANWKCLTVSENVQECVNMLGNKDNVQKCLKTKRNVVKYMKIYGNVLELSEQVWINLRMPVMCGNFWNVWKCKEQKLKMSKTCLGMYGRKCMTCLRMCKCVSKYLILKLYEAHWPFPRTSGNVWEYVNMIGNNCDV